MISNSLWFIRKFLENLKYWANLISISLLIDSVITKKTGCEFLKFSGGKLLTFLAL